MSDGSYFVRKAKGSVDRFFPERGFGFVSVDDHVGPTVFFFVENVIPDQVGRVFVYPPTRVEFDLRKEANGKYKATNVRLLDFEDIDIGSYFEDSQVLSFDAEKRTGFLMRPDGDDLYFCCGEIVTTGGESLRPGDWVRHQIRSHITKSGKERWRATNISVYEPEKTIEEHFSEAEELPIDVPESVVVAQSSVLSLENKNVPIIELIRRRREGRVKC